MRDNLADSTTFQRIKETMVNCQRIPAGTITPDATIETLGGDSLDVVELAILLEEEFNIEIPDVTFDATTQISEITASIERIMGRG